ncbi:hypothetical protein GGR52DRAFT_583747 [Hypoxylon sp. FL1284]|nr:hypothetical protein GGR52DRAFT_583747 [Hypoxylon sp. FL1284]
MYPLWPRKRRLDGCDGVDPLNPDPFGVCAAKGLDPPEMRTPSEVRKEATELATNIFAYYGELQSILERHEATIRKRWEKWTRGQRLAILLHAWPDMPPSRRPDYTAIFCALNLNDLQRTAAENYRCFVWPTVNQEHLGDTKTLMLLLNSRGRNHPHVFAASDRHVMRIGRASLAIVPIFLGRHVMTLNGMTRQEDYGKLISWDEHEDAFNWTTTRKQFLPGEGLLVLEFQERLLHYLIYCCEAILYDIPTAQITSNAFAIQPEPPLKERLDATGFSTLATLVGEAPYRPPGRPDLQKIESLLSAHTLRIEDHIWLLREDPNYFAETLLDQKEHSILVNSERQLEPGWCDWPRITSFVLAALFTGLETFAELRNQATHLRRLSNKYCLELSPQKDLPAEYHAALLKFKFYLTKAIKGTLNCLSIEAVASPPLRPFFIPYYPEPTDVSLMKIKMKHGIENAPRPTRELIWLIRTLGDDGDQLYIYGIAAVLDELESLCRRAPEALALLTPFIAREISDLSVVAECLRQLDMFQPWASGFENAIVDREEVMEEQFAKRSKVGTRFVSTINKQIITAVQKSGDPSSDKLQYPVGERRNKTNVDILRRSEAFLDGFWNSMDEVVCREAGGMDGTAYKKVLSQQRRLQRTPEWVEPASKKKKGKSAQSGQQNKEAYEYIPPSSRLFTGNILGLGTSETKVERRGTSEAEASSGNDVVPRPPESPADDQPPFKVDARALKVFRIVFFDPAAGNTPGEVAWRDFLHAMVSMGFAPLKLHGSVWHFEPTGPFAKASIQFYEPPPKSKISFPEARRHGRRLTWAFGWRFSMFVLKDDKEDVPSQGDIATELSQLAIE